MEKTNIPCKISFYKNESILGLKKAKVYIMHEGTNRNRTNFSLENIEKAKETIKNRPLLAYITVDENGIAKDFSEHEIMLKNTKDGIIYYYLEHPIGVFPESCNPRYEEIGGVTHFVADCYIWEGYSNEAISLLEENNGEKQVSMEISVKDSETLENGVENITDFTFLGVTILGDDVIQGMNGTCGIQLFSNQEKIDKFTKNIKTKIEEIENKECEIRLSKNIYGLGIEELRRLISENLRDYKYERWGDEWSKFYLMDIDLAESVAILYDDEMNTIKGVNFSVEETKVAMDMNNISDYVSVWKKREKEETLNFNLSEKYGEKITELNEKYSEITKLNEDLEKENQVYKEDLEKLKSENEILEEFKLNKEKEERIFNLNNEMDEIVSKFDFKTEEIKEYREKVLNEEMTINDFEKELFVMEGMKSLKDKSKNKFSAKEDKNKLEVPYAFNGEQDKENELKEQKRNAYGGIFSNQIL